MNNNTTDLKYLLISIALHLVLLLVFLVRVVVFPGERPEFVRAVRVDFVALPDKNPTEAPPGVEKPVEKPIEKTAAEISKPSAPEKAKPDSKAQKQIQEQQNSALKRLQALAKIKKLKSQKNEGPEGSSYKGNRLSEGNSLTGVEKVEYNHYLSQLDLHIKKNWLLPEWLAQKPLTASALVRFDEKGNILERTIIKTSGNRDFDKEALQAISASAPLPAPPENLVSYFKVQGIELRFPE